MAVFSHDPSRGDHYHYTSSFPNTSHHQQPGCSWAGPWLGSVTPGPNISQHFTQHRSQSSTWPPTVLKHSNSVYPESNWTDPGCGDPVVMLVITTCYMLRRPPSATTTSHLYLLHISGHRDTAHVTRDTSGAVRQNTSDIKHFNLLFSTTPTSSKSVFTFGSKLKYWRQLSIWKYRILIFCLVSFGLEDEIWRWLGAERAVASALRG